QMQPYLEWLKDVVEPEAPMATALPADEEQPAEPAEEPAEAAEVEVEEAAPEPAQVDVVLVPAQAPAGEPAQTGSVRISGRDLSALGVGGAVVLLALLVGLFLGGVFSRKPPADEPKPDQTTPANKSRPVDAGKD